MGTKGSKEPKAQRARAPETTAPVTTPTVEGASLPRAQLHPSAVVGIGCSAGGLGALERFFSHAPVDSGMAFVVVQHLSPDHPSTLPELLQRSTSMTVVEAADAMPIARDHVYVIAPAKDLSIVHDTLYLLDPTEPRGLRLPIDSFLRSLANDRREDAIGILLSGMGSDGARGLVAVKERGGLTLVQTPETASAEGMPKSAIAAGAADIVAPPEEMSARITAFRAQPTRIRTATPIGETALRGDIEKIIGLLRDHGGADFSLYKNNTMVRRIERRMALHQIGDFATYTRYLRDNPHEIGLLFKEMLIGVTSFFRDPEVWQLLRAKAIPALLARQPNGKTLRAWVAGCSSGEEAYSLAMVFQEVLEDLDPDRRFGIVIYATDLDADAIDKARKGLYPPDTVAKVSEERLRRHFIEEPGGYRVKPTIRQMVVFARQNLITDPPFTKLDILSCRNVLIYFRGDLQKRLLPLFHYALRDDGLLLLGSAETVGSFGQLFTTVNNKARLFRRVERRSPAVDLHFPVATRSAAKLVDPHAGDTGEKLGELTDQLIQQRYSPAAILVTADGDILYISGRTGRYLEPAAGKVNMNIHAMAREGLRQALTGVIHKALRAEQPIQLDGLRVGEGVDARTVDVTVHAIENPTALRGRVLIVFRDTAPPPQGRKRRGAVAPETHEALARELQQTREALQVTHEEMQTSIEELKSTNEELQSTNEELQSTNEEILTSKEEMQSLNEELQTVNAELQSKVSSLTWVQNDLSNLLNSTEIATIFLDGQMKLRRFTPHATRLFKLVPGDIGRPLSDVATDLDYPTLHLDAREVLSSLAFREQQVGTRDGRWVRVRIMPYRTQENVIDGVVITFTDVSEIKRLREQLDRRENEARRPPETA